MNSYEEASVGLLLLDLISSRTSTGASVLRTDAYDSGYGFVHSASTLQSAQAHMLETVHWRRVEKAKRMRFEVKASFPVNNPRRKDNPGPHEARNSKYQSSEDGLCENNRGAATSAFPEVRECHPPRILLV